MPTETLQLMEEETEGGIISSSEGGREIQLAKERLASAKARVESASKNFVAAKETKKQVAKTMEIAKAHEECASKQLDKAKEVTKQAAKTMDTAVRGVNTAQLELLSSQNEVKKAEESLKAAEKRREVVNIDSDSDEEEGYSNNKKRKKGSIGSSSKSKIIALSNSALIHAPAPEFGPGWTKYKVPRKNNKSSYSDQYYVSPKGERFRSKSEVERYLNNPNVGQKR